MYTAPGLLLWYTRIGCDAREQHKQERKTSARTLWVNSLEQRVESNTPAVMAVMRVTPCQGMNGG